VKFCKCGCGQQVTRSKRKPFNWNEFISGHNARVKGRTSGQFEKGNQAWKLRKESKPNSGSFQKGSIPHNFKGGISISDGYAMVLLRDGTRVALHRIIAENKLGRELESDEIVHHINGNRLDNSPDNLYITDRSEHMKIHFHEEVMSYAE